MISIVVQGQKEIESALCEYWKDEPFSVCLHEYEAKVVAGVVYALPCVSLVRQNENMHTLLTEYINKAQVFVEKLLHRVQRPSVCVVISSAAVYGSCISFVSEGGQTAQNDWASWIQRYEQVFSALEEVGVRVVCIRTGVVFTEHTAPKFCLHDGRDGDWISWVERRDLCRFVDLCIRTENAKGMYHLAVPEFVQKKDLRSRRKRDSFLLRNILKAESIFFPSQKITSRRITELDYHFSQTTLMKNKR